jgi:hypothetical protein
MLCVGREGGPHHKTVLSAVLNPDSLSAGTCAKQHSSVLEDKFHPSFSHLSHQRQSNSLGPSSKRGRQLGIGQVPIFTNSRGQSFLPSMSQLMSPIAWISQWLWVRVTSQDETILWSSCLLRQHSRMSLGGPRDESMQGFLAPRAIQTQKMEPFPRWFPASAPCEFTGRDRKLL